MQLRSVVHVVCSCARLGKTATNMFHNCLHTVHVVGLGKESATLLPTIMRPAELYCTHLKRKKQELDFYCKSCNSSVCRDCIISSHKDHNFTELPTVAETHRDEMRRVLKCAQKDTSILAAAIDTNNKMTCTASGDFQTRS